MEKITEISNTLINGNIGEFKADIKKLDKLEFINLIQEYSLLSGESIEETLNHFKRLL